MAASRGEKGEITLVAILRDGPLRGLARMRMCASGRAPQYEGLQGVARRKEHQAQYVTEWTRSGQLELAGSTRSLVIVIPGNATSTCGDFFSNACEN